MSKQVKNLQETIQHQLADCLEHTKDSYGLDNPTIDWNFTERPGIITLETDDVIFEVRISVKKIENE